ncbi:MAG: 3-isopropylmalate dehydratase large subunit [Gammaproteobacteria bacterium]|nr:3-isopropylmalate dehydratase large subunit [Gammaproteobacteria bacterium]
MAGRALYEKIFDSRVVREVLPGRYQLFVDLHLVNEVSSPQAFEALQERGLDVRFPDRTIATADHAVATRGNPVLDGSPENIRQVLKLRDNARKHALPYLDPERGEHGILHVLAPERGMVMPGMTLACGDSHSSTHGAFGALAFGIGTSQVRDVLASQSLLMEKLRVRRISVEGRLGPGVYAKDLALHLIRLLGSKGGVGFAHEFAGPVVEAMDMEARMTLCNMAVEGGARCGYVEPDDVTFSYLKGREHAPSARAWNRCQAYWRTLRSDPDAEYDDILSLDADAVRPCVTWGTSPDQSVAVDQPIPHPRSLPPDQQAAAVEALAFMGLEPGRPIVGTPIDVAFIGSCTNGRISDLEVVARLLNRSGMKVAPAVKALIVPGSRAVRQELHRRQLDTVLENAGFEVRDAGCSLCCGMNVDQLVGREVCASSSNRNFKGRQGSPTGRTLLMSPVMVAAAAVSGAVADAREVFEEHGA